MLKNTQSTWPTQRRSSRWGRPVVAILWAMGVALSAGAAHASPAFPSTLRAELEMECTPTCSGTCHTSDPGESSTASREFASTLRELGMVSGDEQSLVDAIAQLGDTDTDGDGATDAEELTASPPSDPNDANLTPSSPGSGICAAELRYGCGAQQASEPPRPGAWAVLGGLLLAWTLRLRNRHLRI